MGVLLFNLRVHELMKRRSDIQYRILKLTRKMNNLTEYSTLVGNDTLSMAELMSMPGAMMGRTLNYMAYAQNYSTNYMNQNAAYYMQMQAQQNGGQIDPMTQQYIMQSLYNQGREKVVEMETKRLKNEEQRLAAEKEREETMLKEVESELQAAKQARDAGIKDMTPKYTAGGQ